MTDQHYTKPYQKLTGKQERFARFLFEGLAQREAYIQAGYSKKQAMATVDKNAFALANNTKVVSRLAELRKAAEDASVATVLERKQVLSEIVRGRVANFMTNLTKEKLESAALQELTITERPSGKKTNIKLHNPIHAVDLLNKMDRIYGESPQVNIDNRSINFIVRNKEEQEEIAKLVEGLGGQQI